MLRRMFLAGERLGLSRAGCVVGGRWRVREQSKRSLRWARRATVDLLLLVKVSFERTRCVGVTCLLGLARVLRLL